MADARGFASENKNLATRYIGDGPKLPRKRPPFGGLQVRKSYLERETGIEPATLCLGSRCPNIAHATSTLDGRTVYVPSFLGDQNQMFNVSAVANILLTKVVSKGGTLGH